MIMPTERQIDLALEALRALADCIKELKEVPSGHLYIRVMSRMDIDVYEVLIGKLISSGLVEKKNHLLIWKGK